jgi:hypothetical protein
MRKKNGRASAITHHFHPYLAVGSAPLSLPSSILIVAYMDMREREREREETESKLIGRIERKMLPLKNKIPHQH